MSEGSAHIVPTLRLQRFHHRGARLLEARNLFLQRAHLRLLRGLRHLKSCAERSAQVVAAVCLGVIFIDILSKREKVFDENKYDFFGGNLRIKTRYADELKVELM